jgi:hypothetical protein
MMRSSVGPKPANEIRKTPSVRCEELGGYDKVGRDRAIAIDGCMSLDAPIPAKSAAVPRDRHAVDVVAVARALLIANARQRPVGLLPNQLVASAMTNRPALQGASVCERTRCRQSACDRQSGSNGLS